MSEVSPLSGISGLISFDPLFLSPLLFFCLVLLLFCLVIFFHQWSILLTYSPQEILKDVLLS